MDNSDVDIKIVGVHVELQVHRMGGRIVGHSYKKVLFGQETFDFDIDV